MLKYIQYSVFGKYSEFIFLWKLEDELWYKFDY